MLASAPDFHDDERVIVALDLGTSSARARTIEPAMHRHVRYRDARARQRRLDDRV